MRQVELERVKSQAAADYIVDVLLKEAWFQIRCKYEWKQVEAQVEKWGKERRCKSKRIKRKNKAPVTPSDHVCCKTSVHAVAEELQARTSCYSRTAKGLVSLVGAEASPPAGLLS